jgi:hypothetical protein
VARDSAIAGFTACAPVAAFGRKVGHLFVGFGHPSGQVSWPSHGSDEAYPAFRNIWLNRVKDTGGDRKARMNFVRRSNRRGIFEVEWESPRSDIRGDLSVTPCQ